MGWCSTAPSTPAISPVVTTTTYDTASSRVLSRYRFIRGDEEVAVTALHHDYTSAHLDQMLIDAGFTDIAQYCAPDGEPYALGAGRLLLTARRGRVA